MLTYNSLGPDQAWQNVNLIWIQTVWHSDGIQKEFFLFSKKMILKKKSADNKKAKINHHTKS